MRITAIPNFNYSVNNRLLAQKINFKADLNNRGSFFTQVDDYLYRGLTPDSIRDLQELKDAGVSVIVDVAERSLCTPEDVKSMDMQYYHLPVDHCEWWQPRSMKNIKSFFKIADSVRKNRKKMYVYSYSQDQLRTGLMVELYKLHCNIPVDTRKDDAHYAKQVYDAYCERYKNPKKN